MLGAVLIINANLLGSSCDGGAATELANHVNTAAGFTVDADPGVSFPPLPQAGVSIPSGTKV